MSSSLPEIILQRASGQEEALNAYAGQVLLVVNTASQCGFTPQYEALEQLQQHFGGEGFTVLAFPCNQFGRQEPGDDETIASFCETRFHTTFPLFAKTEVNGPEAHPLFTHLKAAAPGFWVRRRSSGTLRNSWWTAGARCGRASPRARTP